MEGTHIDMKHRPHIKVEKDAEEEVHTECCLNKLVIKNTYLNVCTQHQFGMYRPKCEIFVARILSAKLRIANIVTID